MSGAVRAMEASRRGVAASRRFSSCERGTVAITFALLVLPIVVLAGAGIDWGLALRSRANYQHALDAAVTASEMHRELLDEELQLYVRRQLDANLAPRDLERLVAFSIERDGDGVRAHVSGVLAMPFLSLLGVPHVEVRVDSSIAY